MQNHDPQPRRYEFPPKPKPHSYLHLTESQRRGWGKNQHIPTYIWREGMQYFSIRYLASAWGLSRGVVTRWAKARPHLIYLYKDRYLFCRNEEGPPANGRNTHVVPSILRDGLRYFSMPVLAQFHGMNLHSTRAWVKRHPHLALRVGKHNYCRDEEFGGPRRLSPCVEREGHTYWNLPEVAIRHGVSERTARRWAANHPQFTVQEAGHLYARDEEYDVGSRAVASIQHDGLVYYSIRELANRRGISPETVRGWAARRPHLVHREGYYIISETRTTVQGAAPPHPHPTRQFGCAPSPPAEDVLTPSPQVQGGGDGQDADALLDRRRPRGPRREGALL